MNHLAKYCERQAVYCQFEQMRGGRAMYVGRDGGYLIVGSAVDPRKHLEQFEAGDRTASITW